MKKRIGPKRIPQAQLNKFDIKRGAEHDKIVKNALAPHRSRNEDTSDHKR
jgi:hypothetical protein